MNYFSFFSKIIFLNPLCVPVCHVAFSISYFSQQADRFKELYHSEQERNLDLESQNREFKVDSIK